MEPTPQIIKALEIIENVQNTVWKDVWVNKNQCKRVADRFKAIGELLRIYRTNCAGSTSCNSDDSTLDYSAFDELLTVLQKGQALVSNYVERAGIKSALTWSDNREAFKEIHEELETMKAMFPFDGFGDQFETASWYERYEMLTQDVKQDLEAMPQSLPAKAMKLDDEEVIRVALEKSGEATDSRLPSYLQIDITKIIIKDHAREREILSKPVVNDGWAIVCEGSWLGCDFAVKVFKSKQVEWNKDQMLKEVRALLELRHPHIVPFIGFAQGTDSCAVLMEMMPGRDLRHYIENHAPRPRPFTRSQELDIITQIAKGLLCLHTRGYVHGDLECSNILVKKYGDFVEVKIGNLRYAEELQSGGGTSEIRRARWTPPEAVENYGGVKPTDDLLKQGDVYSFAMTCYEIVTGNLPFQDIQGAEPTNMIEEGPKLELPEDLEQSGLKGLLESCWANDRNDRPIFELICVRLDTIRSSRPAVNNMPSGIASSIQTWNANVGAEESEGDSPDDIPEYLRIKPGALRKVQRVGEGASARVYKATWLGCTVAVKRMKMIPLKELKFLIQLRHRYIIQLVGSSIDSEGHCSIVMEYMEGSLRDLINSRMLTKRSTSSSTVRPFGPAEELSIIKKLAQGMAFLHSREVVHRDLKAKNVMCQEHAGYFDVKIVDFGISQFVADAGEGRSAARGTGFWRAPELFDKDAQSGIIDLMAADVYSFAMTCYEVVTGDEPFQGMQINIENIKAGARPELPEDLEQSGLKGLIESCWAKDPNDRPVFDQICICLETICSSNPAVTNKSLRIAYVWNAFKQFPYVWRSLYAWLRVFVWRSLDAWPRFPDSDSDSDGTMGQRESGWDVDDLFTLPKYLIINTEALKRVRLVGKGSSSMVYEVKWLGCTFAMKRMRYRMNHSISDGTIIFEFQQELDFLIQLRHPYIIQLVGYSIDKKGRCSYVMEYMNDNLRDLIDSRLRKSSTAWRISESVTVMLPFEFDEMVCIISKLAQGLAFLHSRGVAHRDLKSMNVMCQEHAGYFTVKVVDFGISQLTVEVNESRLGVGTGYWRAPEIFPTHAHWGVLDLMAADVYSFAMTCYEIVTGLRPFQLEFDDQLTHYYEVIGGLRPELPPALNAGLKDLIVDCWQGDPARRPKFVQICTRLDALL